MADNARGNNHRRARRVSGFTLLEALVAIIMLAAIMTALTLALSTALRAQQTAQTRQEQMGTVRAVFALMTRDVQAAFASTGNPASVFMASSSSSNGSGSNTRGNSLLTFSTLTHRVETSDPSVNTDLAQSDSKPASSQTADQPQSDFALVRYDFDPQQNVLTRTVSAVPNLQTLTQATPEPANTVAQNVASVQLRFWDASQQTWRDDWDFEQQNQQSQTGQTGQAGSSAGGLQSGGSGSLGASSTSGDTSLPSAVEITLLLGKPGQPTTSYVTIVPVLAPVLPTDPNAAAASAAATNAASGATTGAGQ